MENVLSDDCWAIIPARANSKGVAGKNIKMLNNKSLIVYAIESLRNSGVFDEMYVTSDGERILDVAKEFGARTYLRDDEAESNDVSMSDAPTISLLRAVPERVRPKFTFMVQCTSPFVQVETKYDNLCKSSSFIPEIWQGHKNGGDGAWLAMERPEKIAR